MRHHQRFKSPEITSEADSTPLLDLLPHAMVIEVRLGIGSDFTVKH